MEYKSKKMAVVYLWYLESERHQSWLITTASMQQQQLSNCNTLPLTFCKILNKGLYYIGVGWAEQWAGFSQTIFLLRSEMKPNRIRLASFSECSSKKTVSFFASFGLVCIFFKYLFYFNLKVHKNENFLPLILNFVLFHC